MSGPPNDATKQPQLMIGRVVQLSDGSKTIVPLSHKEQVLGHQQRVAELVRVAQQYKDQPSAENLVQLEEAARAL